MRQLATGVRFLETCEGGLSTTSWSETLLIKVPQKVEPRRTTLKSTIRARESRPLCLPSSRRGLELAKQGGVSAMVTMRNWMFIKQYEKLRTFC